jgi:hypothetical protein
MLVLAQDDSGAVGFTFKKGNALASDGGGGAIDLSGEAWSTATSTSTIAVTNVPPGMAFGWAVYGEVAGGVNLPAMEGLDLSGTGDPPPVTFVGHPGYPDFVQTEATVVKGVSDGDALATIATRSAPPGGATTAYDFAALLPFISGATLDTSTPARARASWTTEGPVAADGAIVRMEWTMLDDAGVFQRSSWTVVAPPSVTSVTLPALPASESAWAPPAGADFSAPPVVALVEADFVAGYPALKAAAASFRPTEGLRHGYGAIAPPLPVAGTVRMTSLTLVAD